MNQLEDALKNMLGAFDNPLARLKMGTGWTEFHTEAVESARNAINNGNPLYAPENEITEIIDVEILPPDVEDGQPVIFHTFGTKIILIPIEIKEHEPNLFPFLKIGHITNGIPYFYTNPHKILKLNKITRLDRLIVQ